MSELQAKEGTLVGHSKFDSEYVLSKEPDIILVGAAELFDGNPNIERTLDYYNWISKIMPGDYALLTNQKLYKGYQLVGIKIKEGFFLPLFLKRDSFIVPDGEKIVLLQD